MRNSSDNTLPKHSNRFGAIMLGTALCAGMTLLPWPNDVAMADHQAVQLATGVPAPVPPGPVSDVDQERLRTAFQAMSAEDLSLTYARIYATFRELLTYQDLTSARTLVDYAAIADAEMHRRRVARPDHTESPRAMLLLFELVL